MPNKTLWDHVATISNGLLVLLALVMLTWAACSDGEPTHEPFEPSTLGALPAEVGA
ncbi:MAG: hypothetical protein R3249_05565 [Nitriliruptorales bacterium]|nr:hypothetical protein [Nitriliruptorales bacterium]